MNSVVLCSGGIDSAACAWYLAKTGHEVHPLFVDYGHAAASAEAQAAANLSSTMGFQLHTMKASMNRSFGAGEIRGRNAFLILSAVLSTAYSEPCIIALGIHAGTIYYDCTVGFVNAVDRVVAEQSDGRARVVAPFVSWSKRSVFEYFKASKLPLELTYSCEVGLIPPCGRCLSCKDRRKLG
jgi:7-cyano-7-deazaguanine synthase